MAYPLREHDPERVREEMLIGSKKRFNGVYKYWAGPDLGYQSKETFEKLKKEGYDGDQDYMLLGGWQARRAQLGINKVMKAAAPVVTPVIPHLQRAYEFGTTPLQKTVLEAGGKGLMWGLNKIDQGVTAGSRALGIHPFWGNAAIETAAELATPTVSTTLAKRGGQLLEAVDNIRLPLVNVGTDALDLTRKSKVDETIKAGKARYTAKLNAFDRYDELVAAGYDMTNDTAIQRLINKVDTADNLPKHIKQYTDEAAYRKAVDEHIAKGKPTDRIREEVGVFVDKDGSVKQMQSRGELQLRSKAEATNTSLNRELDRFLQSPEFVSYNSIANVRHFMKEIGFTGSEKQFQKLYELHHVNAIKVYSPFFKNLDPTQAAELRKLAEGAGIYLGNDPRNLVPLLKRKHTLDKDSIHTFMRENGIEGSSKWPFLSTGGNKLGSYNPQARMAALLEGRSVRERFEVLKGFQEWVQKPAQDHLNKLLEAQRLKGTIAQ